MNAHLLCLALATISAGGPPGGETWKRPLEEKAGALEANILKRHNILGLYPSMVEVPPRGGAVDITTATPLSDVVHAVCWTSNYLAGASYRYAFLKKSGAATDAIERARARADEIFEAVYRCQRVTGVRGLQARGYFLGHGEVYEERGNSERRDAWHQGEVDGQAFRWRGDPSHHNYSDAIHGLGQYFDLAAEGPQKERCREAIDALVGYWVDNDLTIADLDRSRRPVPILGLTDGKTLNTRVMMAIAGAKVAHHATGKEKFKKVYEQLLAQYHVRDLKEFRSSKNFDDGEHVFCHLENLFRIETDPELLAAYRKVADGLWANHKGDAHSLFTYIYCAIAPDAPGREQALREATATLQSWPTDMTIRPRMNSVFPDRKPPYPVYQAAWDNEYIWKGNLLTADGWLSRIVTAVAVSREDPAVLYAIDTLGDLYQSRDGAATVDGWRPIGSTPGSPAWAIDVGHRSRVLAAACDGGFYRSLTAGRSWDRLPVPDDGGKPVDVQFDPADPFVLYAITSRGVYRSKDFGEEYLGKSWEGLTHDLPVMPSARFLVSPGKPGRLYAFDGKTLFTRQLQAGGEWRQAGGRIGLAERSSPYDWLVADPANPDRVIAGVRSINRRQGGVGSVIQVSADAGESWTNDLRAVYRAFAQRGAGGMASLTIPGEVGKPAVDAQDGRVLYLPSKQGVRKSHDGGASWVVKRDGLEIPVAETVFAPRHSSWIFAGTPAGLFVSKDRGETWEDGHLTLQFVKNTRRELGGASFIDAYWRARYRGFIGDDAARTASRD